MKWGSGGRVSTKSEVSKNYIIKHYIYAKQRLEIILKILNAHLKNLRKDIYSKGFLVQKVFSNKI